MSDKPSTKHRWWSSTSSASPATTSSASPILTNDTNQGDDAHPAKEETKSKKEKKKSLYQRYQDAKTGRNTQLSDEELLKYTGKTRSQIVEWGDRTPGVAGNQLAGGAAIGRTTGLGGLAMAEGYGGWGREGDNGGANRGLKFPSATVASMNGPRDPPSATAKGDGEEKPARDGGMESDGENNK